MPPASSTNLQERCKKKRSRERSNRTTKMFSKQKVFFKKNMKGFGFNYSKSEKALFSPLKWVTKWVSNLICSTVQFAAKKTKVEFSK